MNTKDNPNETCLGGQGRTDKEIQESGEIFYASCVLAGFVLAACLAVAVWMGMKT